MTPTNGPTVPFGSSRPSIAELRRRLERGEVSRASSWWRTASTGSPRYDRSGIRLNAVPVLNPDVFADAQAADERRARGERRGPLDGIPYTAKDSYQVAGLTVAAGSPAFEHLVASA